MKYLSELFSLPASESRSDVEARFDKCWSLGDGPSPLILHIGDDNEILVEFDSDEKLIFAEINTYFNSQEEARLYIGEVDNFVRNEGLIVPEAIITKPHYRTSLPVKRVMEWRAWLEDDVTIVQASMGRMSGSSTYNRYGVSVSKQVIAGGKRHVPTANDHSKVDRNLWEHPELDVLELSLGDMLKVVRFVTDGHPELLAQAERAAGDRSAFCSMT